MLSKFATKIKISYNDYIVLNNLLFEPVLMSRNAAYNLFNNKIDFFNKEQIDILYKKGILVDNISQDVMAQNILKQTVDNICDKHVGIIYMIPVDGCNLCCKYCFIGKIDNKKDQIMKDDTIENTIKQFAEHLKRNCATGTIIFYGGEPTIKFDILQETANLVNKYAKDIINISIVTNGTIINDEIINFFKDNNISVGISIDGPKELTDKYRIFKKSNESVYELVLNNIEKLKISGVNFGLSIVVSNETLDDKEYFDWLKTLNVKNINFNLMHYNEKTNDWKNYYKRIGRFLFEAYDKLKPSNISDSRLLRKFISFYSNEFKHSDCAAIGGEQLCIKPNGDVTVCHAYWNSDKEICGNINENTFSEIMNTDIYKKWQNNLTINKKQCLHCPAIKICGGGCAKQSETLFGDQNKVDRSFCIYTKYALKELFKRTIKENCIQIFNIKDK